MKKFISLLLSVAVSITCFSVGIYELGDVISDKIEYKHIEKLYNEVSALTGDIENRVVVTSKKKLDSLGAVQTASGHNNIQVFQYETSEQADAALDYFSSLDCVENAELDRIVMPFDDAFFNNDDAKCYASATDNIDDMIKLVKANYSSLSEVKIAVIDSGCEVNDLTADKVINTNIEVGTDNDHGTKICGTIIYNTMDNVKIYSYDVGDTNGFSNIAIQSALNMAYADGCKLVNMSFGGYTTTASDTNLVKQCYNNGMILVAASGNDGRRMTASDKTYPCSYNEVIGIGALSPERSKASFSNYGTGVDFYTGGTFVRSFQSGSEVYWSGTSAATPVAVSIFANILSVCPTISFDELKASVSKLYSHDDNTSYSYIDGYETLSGLINKELPQAQFTYRIREYGSQSVISVYCDSDVRLYVKAPSISILPVNNSRLVSGYLSNGQTVGFNAAATMNIVAYADGKRKSVEQVINLPLLDSLGYTYNSASNEITACQNFTDKVIEVPSQLNGNPVTSIGASTFAGNTNVETIIVPKTITNIGAYAFANCPKLKKVIVLGNADIGRFAFENCPNLKFFYSAKTSVVNTCGLTGCNNLVAVDVYSLSDSNYSYIRNTAFFNSDNIINFDKTTHKFVFDNIINDNSFRYKCNECNETVELQATELLDMWDAHIISRKTIFSNYSSMFLFDVSGDGIINAKDYSIINALTK